MSIPMIQELSLGKPLDQYVRPAKLNIFIGDASGSMGDYIRQLAQDMMGRIDKIPRGDALLLGIFSSPGWYRWLITRELSETNDYEKCKAIIQEELYARAMTCFSEILIDTPQAIRPFLGKYQVATLTFFSDGIPTVYPIQKEDKAIDDALTALAPIITSSSIIAYGDYSDRKRLARMAQILGGEFIATDNVHSIGETLERSVGKRSSRRKKVKLPSKNDFVFTLGADGTVGSLVSSFNVKGGEVSVDEQDSVYILNYQAKSEKTTTPLDVQYAAVLALLSDNRIDEAINFLSAIGDVALVEALSSALTNAEIARAELLIREALTDPRKRFTKGQQPNCLPKEDAFDLLDCLGLLMDDDCKFYPYHPGFQYKRIGRATKVKPGYPKFIPTENVAIGISGLVGNQSELNLSVRAQIPGTIELPDQIVTSEGNTLKRHEVNLPEIFPTHIFRNYTVISNALLAVTTLPLTVKNSTIATTLQDNGVLSSASDGEISVADFTKIPICNRKRGKEANDWQAIANLAYSMLEVGSVLKVLKAKRDELDPDREAEQSVQYTPEQIAFLSACGVDRNGAFSPPVDQEEPTDVLDVRTFEAKIDKGSPVSIKDFTLMLEGKKKFNFVGEMMKIGHDLIEGGMPKQKGTALVWLNSQIKAFTETKRTLDQEFNARRFAAVLNGLWGKSFKEDSAEFMVGPKKDRKVTLIFKTIQKKI